MRMLAAGRVLWVRRAALPIDALPALLRAPAEAIAVAIDQLCEEGLAGLSADGVTLRLTERGARAIVSSGTADGRGGPSPRVGKTPG
jgi:hypothetical protein